MVKLILQKTTILRTMRSKYEATNPINFRNKVLRT